MSTSSCVHQSVLEAPGAGITLRLGRYAIQIHYRSSRVIRQVELDPWEERDRIGMLNRRIEAASRSKDDWWW